MIIIGHASISENGTINGAKGDQTGGEVTTRSYYDKGWIYVYVPKSDNVAMALVTAMKNACSNNNIGYGQKDRLTLYNELLRIVNNGRILPETFAKVRTKVNCDCSSLVAACCIACGLKVSPDMTTWIQYGALKATGAFDIKNWNALKNKEKDLRLGSILQSSGHTAIVLETDRESLPQSGKVTARYPAYNYDSKLSGLYTVRVSTFLSVRDGGSVNTKELCKLYNGELVMCYGYYTSDFLYIQFTKNNILYTGFAHKDYLYRV